MCNCDEPEYVFGGQVVLITYRDKSKGLNVKQGALEHVKAEQVARSSAAIRHLEPLYHSGVTGWFPAVDRLSRARFIADRLCKAWY
ncbi:uncharacterized protein FFFS_15913 [Fusarium fujikuroi]|nr:uncharacterized protein FFFS_15913 [Fusarium fujikuroi]